MTMCAIKFCDAEDASGVSKVVIQHEQQQTMQDHASTRISILSAVCIPFLIPMDLETVVLSHRCVLVPELCKAYMTRGQSCCAAYTCRDASVQTSYNNSTLQASIQQTQHVTVVVLQSSMRLALTRAGVHKACSSPDANSTRQYYTPSYYSLVCKWV